MFAGINLKAEKMETTLLGLALPGVLKQLKEMLIRQGFIVQTIPTADPVIVAFKEGNWLRRPKKFVLEIRSEEKDKTRIIITAISTTMNEDHHTEEILEAKFVSKLYSVFNKVIQKPYGI